MLKYTGSVLELLQKLHSKNPDGQGIPKKKRCSAACYCSMKNRTYILSGSC